MMQMSDLLVFMCKHGASDLHISAGEPPMLRVDGEMNPLDISPLKAEDCLRMVQSIMNEQQKSQYALEWELDFAVEIKGLSRFRVNAFMQKRGPGAVFRVIPTKILTFDQLGLPDICAQVVRHHRGLVLVTGPTGSGKSTTLAAMIDYVNKNMRTHILTIEDPVEFVHVSQRSLVNQREVGTHTESFSRALKSALREDPDIILVGEMRDLETISLAISAAETGHLVLGTLHTNSAPKTIDRIIDVFPANEQSKVRTQLAESIQAVISQMLLKKKGGGRVAAHEIMLGIPAVRNMIRENKIFQIASIIQTGQRLGMQTMDQAYEKLVAKGLIDPPEDGEGGKLREVIGDSSTAPIKYHLTAAEKKVEFVKPKEPPSARQAAMANMGISAAPASTPAPASAPAHTPAPASAPAHTPAPASSTAASGRMASSGFDASSAPSSAPLSAEEQQVMAKFSKFAQQLERYDYYQILGVPRTSGPASIHQAYEKRLGITPLNVLKNTQSDEVRATLTQILDNFAEAYLILKDPGKRRRYDAGLNGDAKQLRAPEQNEASFRRSKQETIQAALNR